MKIEEGTKCWSTVSEVLRIRFCRYVVCGWSLCDHISHSVFSCYYAINAISLPQSISATPDVCTLKANKTKLMDKAHFVCVVRVNEGTCLNHCQLAPVQTLYLCRFANTWEIIPISQSLQPFSPPLHYFTASSTPFDYYLNSSLATRFSSFIFSIT